jgi:hypothetical protein
MTWLNLAQQCVKGQRLLLQGLDSVAYPGIFFRVGGSTTSVEDRGQRERGSGGGSPLVRGSAQYANE